MALFLPLVPWTALSRYGSWPTPAGLWVGCFLYFDWLIDHVYNDLIHCAWADSLWLSVTQQVSVALHSAFESPLERCSVLTGWDVVGAMQNGCHLCTCSVHTLQPCFSLVLFKATCVHPVRKGMLGWVVFLLSCFFALFFLGGGGGGGGGISVIHPTLTWTAGPLMHVCDLFACTYTQGDIRWSFGWVASLVVFFLQCASGLGLSFQFCGLQIYICLLTELLRISLWSVVDVFDTVCFSV